MKTKNQKGLVMVVVLSTIAFLIIIIQEIAFDTEVELKHGVSRYQKLKSYYSAKSGMELSLLQLMIYKRLSTQVKKLPPIVASQAHLYLHQLWQRPVKFPPDIPEELSDTKKSTIQNTINVSMFKDQSYKVHVESEGSKLHLYDLSSPISALRNWTRSVLYRLLINIRDKHSLIADTYNTNQVQEIVNTIDQVFNPSHSLSQNPIMNLDDLAHIKGIPPEWIELMKPYVTIHGESGIHFLFAPDLLLLSLHDNLTKEAIQNMRANLQNQARYFLDIQSLQSFFNEMGWSFMEDYFVKTSRNPPLAQLVFNTNAPQNFTIRSQGFSGNTSQGMQATLFDPHPTFERMFTLLEKDRKEKYTPNSQQKILNSPVRYQASPFIIEWKDVD